MHTLLLHAKEEHWTAKIERYNYSSTLPFFPKPIFQPELVVRDSLPRPVRSLSFRPSDEPPPYPFDADMPLGVRSGRAVDALRPRLLWLGIIDGVAGGDERPVPDEAGALVADRDDIIDELRSLLCCGAFSAAWS